MLKRILSWLANPFSKKTTRAKTQETKYKKWYPHSKRNGDRSPAFSIRQVREIRQEAKTRPMVQIARDRGVAYNTITRIVNHKTYANVKDLPKRRIPKTRKANSLSAVEVHAIISANSDITNSELGKRYNLQPLVVWKIRNGAVKSALAKIETFTPEPVQLS